MSLENKTVIVTGASTGIGRETSIELGKIGMNVVIGNRNEKLGNEVNEKLNKNISTLNTICKTFDSLLSSMNSE